MKIENIIVHEVRKEEDQSVATIFARDEENIVDAHAQTLSTQLSGLFRKTGLLTGRFETPKKPDDPQPHFVTLLETHFDEDSFENFVAFSDAAARDFKRKLDGTGASKGGYLWFNHYTYNEENFLSIVLLRKKNGLALSNDLTLDRIEQLDLDKLHMAARINLTAWLSGTSTRFIAFRIGRGATDVTEYFAKFVGCEEYTRARADTQNLVQVTKRYCAANNFSDDKSEDVKQFVFERCNTWLDEGEPVLLDRISELLDASFTPEEQGRFLEIAQDDPFFLSNEIPIEKSALRGLTRYSGKTKKLSLSFDSDLINISVFYNESNEEIRITDVPIKLKEQLATEEV
ncbi:nucleoid-associated protein [Moritella sp.]|uniref:nucleoid-associated protein n=1 Tax=Moritella sp. TaxID=78556 RepID=UPI0025FAAB20|nr:nucleoid-associated protein [Moritella sp.]MCJ8351945.1 nucleoid-associated protein [Moritella sp.]